VEEQTVFCATVEEIGPAVFAAFEPWMDRASCEAERTVNVTMGPTMYCDYHTYVVTRDELLDDVLSHKGALNAGQRMELGYEAPLSLMRTRNLQWITAAISLQR